MENFNSLIVWSFLLNACTQRTTVIWAALPCSEKSRKLPPSGGKSHFSCSAAAQLPLPLSPAGSDALVCSDVANLKQRLSLSAVVVAYLCFPRFVFCVIYFCALFHEILWLVATPTRMLRKTMTMTTTTTRKMFPPTHIHTYTRIAHFFRESRAGTLILSLFSVFGGWLRRWRIPYYD